MRHFKRCVWILVAAVMLWSTGMSRSPYDTAKHVDLRQTSTQAIQLTGAAADQRLHLSEESELQSIATDGILELLFDETSYAVSIRETTSRLLWHSLPSFSTGSYREAAVLSLEVEEEGTHYRLNSQDHALPYGGVSYAPLREGAVVKGLAVTYTFCTDPDRLTSFLSSGDAKGSSVYVLTVNYLLKDGSLFVTVDCSKVVNTPTSHLLKLTLLEYLGASRGNEQDGFFLLPDGSGAVMDLSQPSTSLDQISLPIYGHNLTVSDQTTEVTSQAVLPLFGVQKSNGAFVSIIEKGDALATVHAQRGTPESFHRVWSTFSITDSTVLKTGVDAAGKAQFLEYYAQQPYQGEIQLCYRFLSQSNANFTGMSISCREQLIRNGSLSTKTVEEVDYLPFNLTVVGTSDKTVDAFGVRGNSTKVLTSFNEALDMIAQIRAKGINHINLRYKGMFSGGVNQQSLSSVRLNRRLGSTRDYRDLVDYMEGMKLSFFADVNLLTSSQRSFGRSGSLAQGILLGEATYQEAHSMYGQIPYAPPTYIKNLAGLGALENAAASFLRHNESLQFPGVCINDAGKLLYSDFSGSYINREDAKRMVSVAAAPLNTNRNRMVSGGNLYLLKQADFAVNLPTTSYGKQNDAGYRSVPFLQMILHGTLEYSLTPINWGKDYRQEMLRCVEYGALPHFEWIYQGENAGGQKALYYAGWLTIAADFYQQAQQALYDLRSVRMVNHQTPLAGVTCTEYENGAMIYVNYTDQPQQVGRVVIPPMDFLRVG